MIQQNELVVSICSIGMLIFLLSYRKYLWRVPGSRLVLGAYSLLVAGWVLTVLEGFFWPNILNLLEHLCHTTSSIMVVLWIIRLPLAGETE